VPQDPSDPKGSTAEIIGESAAACALRSRIETAAPTDTVVLFSGPVGSGRELAARALHGLGTRAAGPFVPVPCAALSVTLAESELFGHERGAFTGAVASHAGLLERASGGTVFLDEVAEIPPLVQPKFLRFLEERTVTPLGGSARPVNVRVTASTSRDLLTEVRQGRFREDLYFRLRVLGIDVAPLAERGDDVMLLAEHFLAETAAEFGRAPVRLAECAVKLLKRYPWPGNVQELKNCLRGALVFAEGEELEGEDIDIEAPASGRGVGTLKALVARVVAETEKRAIVEALGRAGGNRTEAAKELGLSRRGLQIKMKLYRLQ
jgi:DNA-binding NtrC family response regulator